MQQEDYTKFEKKYSLPLFTILDKEFEISAIDLKVAGNPLRAILRFIINKLAIILTNIEPVLTPNSLNIHAMIEIENISQEEKQSLFALFKQLSHIYHKAIISELLSEEKELSTQINLIYKEWLKLKPQIKSSLEVISESWTKEKEKEKTYYSG